LRDAIVAMHQAAQQARALHVGPGTAPGTTAGSSLVGLQRTVSSLRDRLDVEKKATNGLQVCNPRCRQSLAPPSAALIRRRAVARMQ
jgi:hypothetical protein